MNATIGGSRKPDANVCNRALPSSYSKFRSLSFPNIHLATKRRNTSPVKEPDEMTVENEALNMQMRGFRISSEDKKSTRSSASFGSKLQDKCKAFGCRISSGRHAVSKAGDREGSTSPCSDSLASTKDDSITICTSEGCGNIQADGNGLRSKGDYVYNNSRVETTLSKEGCSRFSEFSEVNRLDIPKEFLDEEIDPKNNQASVNMALPEGSCRKEKGEVVHEPWDDLTFITYPQELLR